LLTLGAQANFTNDFVKMTPLHWAAYNDDPKTTQLLLDNGATQTYNSDNNSPIDIAGMCNNKDVVDVFLSQMSGG
jgi:ankyrin repeat protein